LQRLNGELYVRGLIEHGARKSLQPTLFRLGESGARYGSMQQFVADSPWSPGDLLQRVSERVVGRSPAVEREMDSKSDPPSCPILGSDVNDAPTSRPQPARRPPVSGRIAESLHDTFSAFGDELGAG
jgi:hypothetical protein